MIINKILTLKQTKMKLKVLILKIIGWHQPQQINNKPISLKTTHPDQYLKFDEWSKRFNVSRKYSLLEDSEYLRKIRRNDISSINVSKSLAS